MEMSMRMSPKVKNGIIIAILLAIALVSFFWISGIASSEDSFTGTYDSLNEKRTTVTELMGVTAASSTAISLLPGDAGTPIAVLMFFIWLIKLLTGVSIQIPNIKLSKAMKSRRHGFE